MTTWFAQHLRLKNDRRRATTLLDPALMHASPAAAEADGDGVLAAIAVFTHVAQLTTSTCDSVADAARDVAVAC